ncbi:ATP-binding protein [Lewinella sp. IMCC34183]|uniref:hybrid sensor histidine kinase/response regulator transcription factor n=1 Tax=Lewinella sp. IMCC34183 TaxID=2248762 RepID=UPI000E238265|nr:ATP-binding protein [Lewinella sp. IMCC34183]
MNVSHSLLTVVVYLCLQTALSGQDLFTQRRFHRLAGEQGFPTIPVSDFLQDSLGQIWVGTTEGVYRYQGDEFESFARGQGGNRYLPNTFVDDLYLDAENQVWIITDGGVSYYSYATDRIVEYRPDELTGSISSMAVSATGTRYFATYKNGILKVEGDSLSLLQLFSAGDSRGGGQQPIYDIVIAGRYLWGSLGNLGVLRYDLEDGETDYLSAEAICGESSLAVLDLYVVDEDSAWIATSKGVYHLAFDGSGGKRVDASVNRLLPPDGYLAVIPDANGELWIGSRANGLFQVTDTGEGYRLVNHFPSSEDVYGPSDHTVSNLFQDRNRQIWVGTHRGGVNVFDPAGETVRTIIERSVLAANSLNYPIAWGLETASTTDLWVGTDGGGLSRLDVSTGRVTNNAIPELDGQAILCITNTSTGLWFGTYSAGLFHRDTVRGTTRQYAVGSAGSELVVNDIRCIFEAPDRTVYFGTNRGGLYRYDAPTETVRRVDAITDIDIRAIRSGDGGVLWMGTYGEGLLKFNPAANRLEESPWSRDPAHRDDVIHDLLQRGDTLWVASRNHGVVPFNTRTGTFLPDPVLARMSDRSISAVTMDGAHNLWITTNQNVIHYDRSTNRLQSFGTEDGILEGPHNFGSAIYVPGLDYVAIGGMNGLSLFPPGPLAEPPAVRPIIINQLTVLGEAVYPDSSGILPEGESIYTAGEVRLTHNQDIFSLRFSRPGYTRTNFSGIEYRLAGYEDDWQLAGPLNTAVYRKVPPGRYVFQVRRAGGGAERRLPIIISPPLWKTWPAYLLYTALILLVGWRLIRANNNRIALRQKLQYEQETSQRERELADEKLRFYTNFSHELKTPLTLIRGPVQDLLLLADDPTERQLLQLVRRNTDILTKFIERMLQFRRTELNKMPLNAEKLDLGRVGREAVDRFRYLAADREVTLTLTCAGDLHVWADREQLQIVIDNLLSNALKFTPRTQGVEIILQEAETEVVVAISDRGVGIAAEEIENIFQPFFQASNSVATGGTGIGLSLSKSFVELHEGTISVRSEAGHGTTFTFRLPRGRAHLERLPYVRFVESRPEIADAEAQVPRDAPGKVTLDGSEPLLLVIDDQVDICDYLAGLFSPDFEVLTAHNGASGYALAVANAPDIIISDVMMPGMDGREFCTRIKTQPSTSHIPVIMLTALDSQANEIEGYEVGADAYLTKPFDPDVLRARVHNLLANRARLQPPGEEDDCLEDREREHPREAAFLREAEAKLLELTEQSAFSVPDLCRELGMSQSVLYRKLKLLTDESIQAFAKRVRLQAAARQLIDTDRTITEIAYTYGFTDLKYFRKCFRDRFETTPSSYRKR